jgi:hypothetical protein
VLLRNVTSLVLGFFLLTVGLAQSQTTQEKPYVSVAPATPKKWRVVDGFRSAKFGMSEQQVMRAIAKDFKISKNKVARQVTSAHKTTALIIHLPKVFPLGGPADIVYLLGYKSKRLMRVNVDWGKGVTDNFPHQDIFSLLRLLQTHFMKQKYKKEGFLVNTNMTDKESIVFRGKDLKDRMILLVYRAPKLKEQVGVEDAQKNVSLILSYIENVENPDIIPIKTK